MDDNIVRAALGDEIADRNVVLQGVAVDDTAAFAAANGHIDIDGVTIANSNQLYAGASAGGNGEGVGLSLSKNRSVSGVVDGEAIVAEVGNNPSREDVADVLVGMSGDGEGDSQEGGDD